MQQTNTVEQGLSAEDILGALDDPRFAGVGFAAELFAMTKGDDYHARMVRHATPAVLQIIVEKAQDLGWSSRDLRLWALHKRSRHLAKTTLRLQSPGDKTTLRRALADEAYYFARWTTRPT